MKTFLKIFFSVSLGAAFIWLACRNVDTGRIFSIISKADISFVLAALAIFLFTQLMRAERWRVLLSSPGKEYDYFGIFKIFWLGVFANYIFPARLGEFSRPVLMKKIYGASFTNTLGMIVVERLFDLLGQVLLFIFVSFFVPLPAYIRSAGYLIAGLLSAAVVVLVIMKVNLPFVERIISKLLKGFPAFSEKLLKMLRSFMEGLKIIDGPAKFAKVFFYTMASWFVSAVTIMFAVKSMGIELKEPYISACFMQVVISLALVIPPPPGFIGTFHYFCKESLKYYGVNDEISFSFAVLFHGIQILVVAVLGFAFLISYGLGFKNLMSSEGES